MAQRLLKHPVMNTLRLALALFALAAASTSTVARAEIANGSKATQAMNVGATVAGKCSVNELENSMDVSCELALPPRVEQSAVYTVQIDGQQVRFTTTTINF